YPLLKGDELFMLRVQRYFKQGIQFLFKFIPGLVRAAIIIKGKFLLKLFSLYQHFTKASRPRGFVALLKVNSFAFQMGSAGLMPVHLCMKMRLPTIMYNGGLFRYIRNMFVNCGATPVGRSGNIGGMIVLPCPEPMLHSIDLHTRFISTNNTTINNTF